MEEQYTYCKGSYSFHIYGTNISRSKHRGFSPVYQISLVFKIETGKKVAQVPLLIRNTPVKRQRLTSMFNRKSNNQVVRANIQYQGDRRIYGPPSPELAKETSQYKVLQNARPFLTKPIFFQLKIFQTFPHQWSFSSTI